MYLSSLGMEESESESESRKPKIDSTFSMESLISERFITVRVTHDAATGMNY